MTFPAPSYPHAELTHRIIGCFYDVYHELGAGLREVVYQRAMAIALRDKGYKVDRESHAGIVFRGRPVGRFRPDMIVDQRVLVELKALPTIEASHYTQVINALRAKRLNVGLLLNFGPKPQVKRLITTDPPET